MSADTAQAGFLDLTLSGKEGENLNRKISGTNRESMFSSVATTFSQRITFSNSCFDCLM